jgi:hypothetical protein
MTESVNQRGKSITGSANQRAIEALLTSIQVDLVAIRQFMATHQHSALNAAPSTAPAALNTLP